MGSISCVVGGAHSSLHGQSLPFRTNTAGLQDNQNFLGTEETCLGRPYTLHPLHPRALLALVGDVLIFSQGCLSSRGSPGSRMGHCTTLEPGAGLQRGRRHIGVSVACFRPASHILFPKNFPFLMGHRVCYIRHPSGSPAPKPAPAYFHCSRLVDFTVHADR
jgi:hypothetical protein